jgi:uncharacterized protein
VRLFAIPPKGLELPLAHGIVRGSFRDSLSKPESMIPGQRYRLNVDLGSSAAALPAGYRLRIEVAASSFPLYDRNTNTAEGPFSSKTVRSIQKVHHQRKMASSILLPILPE